MKKITLTFAALVLWMSFADAADRNKPARVPPPGIAIKESDRRELRSGADDLARTITVLTKELAEQPRMLELLPDVQVFHKAVDWALRYDEFYRSNEVGLARSLLKAGQQRAQELRAGKPSWLTATGLVVRGYVSKIDGSIQPYGLVVPADFATDRTKARRLDVWLHGRDNNLTELKFIADRQRSYGEFTAADTFVLHPYGRYCNAFKFAGEVDVFEAMEHVQRSYRIDDRRIALRGFSMGGAGAWHMAAHHPDVWAVASPGAGFAETAEYTKALAKEPKPLAWEQKLWQLYDATDYAANFANLPVIAYNGTEDPQRQAADVMERAMKAEGIVLPRVWGTNVGHKYTPEAKVEIGRFLDESLAQRKQLYRAKTHLTTRTLRYDRGPGMEIRGLGEHWKRADLIVDGDARLAFATNVTTFSLEISLREFTVNNQLVRWEPSGTRRRGIPPRIIFTLGKNGQWTGSTEKSQPALVKRHGLQGPIDDAFMESFLIVRPTSNSRNEKLATWVAARLSDATNDWRAQFRGDARVKDDSQVTDADIAIHHLVLFGDPQSNRLLARLADKLPVEWSAQTIRVGRQAFPTATHAPVFIFPNPLNPQRYIVVNSDFTFAAAGAASNAQQTPKLPDYAVLQIDDNSVVMADFFDEQWRLR